VPTSMSCRSLWFLAVMLGTLGLAGMPASAQHPRHGPAPGTGGQACPSDESGLKLPPGFCATVFADGIGHARDMVVTTNSVMYVNTWSGRYYGNDTPHAGGFLVALQDTTGSGKADVNERFGAPSRAAVPGVQLHANWPDLYKPEEEATLPSEELLLLRKGGDYGWPECYYDGVQRAQVQC
jgi:glucose/arabinose dehydrogenase